MPTRVSCCSSLSLWSVIQNSKPTPQRWDFRRVSLHQLASRGTRFGILLFKAGEEKLMPFLGAVLSARQQSVFRAASSGRKGTECRYWDYVQHKVHGSVWPPLSRLCLLTHSSCATGIWRSISRWRCKTLKSIFFSFWPLVKWRLLSSIFQFSSSSTSKERAEKMISELPSTDFSVPEVRFVSSLPPLLVPTPSRPPLVCREP